MAKSLKLKYPKFWRLIPTFVKVTGEKLVGRTFCPLILNRFQTFNFRCDMTISFLFVLGKVPLSDRNKSVFEILPRDMDHEKIGWSIKFNGIGDCIRWDLCKRICSYILHRINRHQHAESCSCWSSDPPYWDSNVKRGTQTQELKVFFLKKMNCITHWQQFWCK